MGQAAGIVEVLSIKAMPRGGNSYNFKLSDGIWYGHGFDAPSFVKGDNVTFNYAENGNFKNVDAASVVISAVEAAKATGGSAKASVAAYSPNATQLAISYQAARKDALQIIDMALRAEALSLGSKKAEKLSIIEAMVDQMTTQFFEDTKVLGKATVDITASVAPDSDD